MTARQHRPRRTARRLTALRAALVAALLVTACPALASAATGPVPAADAADAAGAPELANLDHLDFLTTSVTPPAQAGHTTYRIEQEPAVGTLWTYADARDGDAFERVGGGPFDEATGTYGQGAFNADDVSRAAVVYLRHWNQHRDDHSRSQAYEMLRGLTYLQTDAGPDAGNVVLWMQPDGTLNPSPQPVELPDPSDSGASYWLARTTWALGEGYAAFADDDPEFAAFLADRLDLALGAIERQSLVRYGTYDVADGVKVPAWLIVDGADASAEAAIGLAAFVQAAPPPSPLLERSRTALRQLAEGVAAMSAGDARHYPYGAILPWTHSRSFWHAWSSQMPVGLVAASAALDEPGLREAAVEDAATFTPYLMTATGAVNGWTPTPSDVTQIAYGTDARLQSLLAVADAQNSDGLADVAAMTAGWYFGANRAGTPMYERSTGVTYDGLAPDGTVNRNSGAESTIHGLLSMLALEAHPGVAAKATSRTSLRVQDGVHVVEAEGAATQGGSVVTSEQTWTGESAWSGGAYLSLPAGASARLTVPASTERRLVQPVVDLAEGSTATADWRAGSYSLGPLSTGVGAQGVTEAPGALLPTVLKGAIGPTATTLDVSVGVGADQPVRLDAVMLRPAVSRLVLSGGGGSTVLLSSAAGQPTARRVDVPGTGRATVSAYDGRGRLVARWSTGKVIAPILDGGFTIVDRP